MEYNIEKTLASLEVINHSKELQHIFECETSNVYRYEVIRTCIKSGFMNIESIMLHSY